jgi:hypothetical protein
MKKIKTLAAFSTKFGPFILLLLELCNRNGIKDNKNKEEGIR